MVELFKGVQSVRMKKILGGPHLGPLYGAANAIKRTGVGWLKQ